MTIHLYETVQSEEGDVILILSVKAHARLSSALNSHPLKPGIKTLFKECKIHRAGSSDSVLYEWYDSVWRSDYSLFLSQVFLGLSPDEFRLVITTTTERRLGSMSEGFNYCVASRVLFEENESTKTKQEKSPCLISQN